MVIITNDTSTLNGALSELGETLASNITQKGVTASASDGLTTLANKVLQITGGGGSTTLFEDDCSSASGLSDYGNSHYLKNSSASATLSYDSGMNAYKILGNTIDGFADIPIPSLDGEDDYTIEAEFYTTDSSTKGQSGFVIYDSSDTGGNGTMYRDIASINRCGVLKFVNGSENAESGNSQQSSLPVYNNWYKLKLEINGTSVKGTWLKTDDTEIYSHTYTTPTYSNIRIGLATLTWSNPYYVRNIKAVSQGGGSDCSQYTTQIADAIEYINGSGS